MWLGLLLGLIFGIGAMLLLKKGFIIRWYIWLLSALAFLSLYGGITHYVGSIHEYEPTAGLYGLLVFVCIFVILAALAFQLAWRQNKPR
ncbi:reductive dehalogenase anchoring protein [Dehalococcoides mccartyi VS]|uniref:Reductive dehalogenase anchoring protein n=1 Tax=Dehalococcoides mccartyi (strain VS) TaxID=311424 RepID=D2BG20_DEHMV|nr:reductive dehalogenase anchoring protein [Dehalococcoides mccartyi VS]